jgi:outer membrane protein OmpA-like peptidoglycan-associated protein
VLAEISRLWPWLLACFGIGAAAGALTRRPPENGVLARWLVWTALAFGVGVLLVRLGALAAAATLVEGALAAYAAFIIGAALGALAKHRSIWAHEGWAVGLIAASLLWVGAAVINPSDGQDRRRYAGPTESAAPAAPATPGNADAAPPAAPTQASIEAPVAAKASRTPVTPTPALTSMTVANCQTALEEVSMQSELTFPRGSARLTASAALALDKATEIIRRCPESATIEVRGHVYGSGARTHNEALARRRVEATIGYLERQGLGGRRLVASGGEPEPAEKRAIVFTVR